MKTLIMQRKWILMKNCLGKVLALVFLVVLFSAGILWDSGDPSAREEKKTLAMEKRQLASAEFQVEEKEEQLEHATYILRANDGRTNEFINRVDGYRLEIPKNMTIDMSISSVRTVLENEQQQVEIYHQKSIVGEDPFIPQYMGYSNRFMHNQTDYVLEIEDTIELDNKTFYVLQWSRKPLKKVENDRCYYASVELPLTNEEVVTFLFKSSVPYPNMDYLAIVRTFSRVPVSQGAFTQTKKVLSHQRWDEKTEVLYADYFGLDAPLRWGIFEPDAPLSFDALYKIEEAVSYRFPILLYYTGMIEGKEEHPKLALALDKAKAAGRLLELTLQTAETKKSKSNMVYDVLNGKYDVFLTNYAREVAAFDEPILFRLGNEMNGDWCPYSAYHTGKDTEIFRTFYRYIFDLFQEAGADNVIWVWNPNAVSFPNYKWNHELCYYPGDEYVDVVGMTAYNTGTYYDGEDWTEFAALYDDLYQTYLAVYEKPLMITEFASSSVGGDKAAWVENMFQHIRTYDQLKMAIWWDGCDWDAEGNVARPYFIDETEEIINIFRNNLKDGDIRDTLSNKDY